MDKFMDIFFLAIFLCYLAWNILVWVDDCRRNISMARQIMATRSEFTKPTKRLALKRSGFKCEAVGVMYGLGKDQRCNSELGKGIEYDHIVRAADGGDNSLSNCAAVCISCHREKTRKFDVPQAAKTKRMQDKHTGIARPKQTIKGASFQSGNKRKQHPIAALPPRSMFASRDS